MYQFPPTSPTEKQGRRIYLNELPLKKYDASTDWTIRKGHWNNQSRFTDKYVHNVTYSLPLPQGSCIDESLCLHTTSRASWFPQTPEPDTKAECGSQWTHEKPELSAIGIKIVRIATYTRSFLPRRSLSYQLSCSSLTTSITPSAVVITRLKKYGNDCTEISNLFYTWDNSSYVDRLDIDDSPLSGAIIVCSKDNLSADIKLSLRRCGDNAIFSFVSEKSLSKHSSLKDKVSMLGDFDPLLM